MNKYDLQNEWKEIIHVDYIECHRIGWLGVWDSLKAIITNNKRPIVKCPVTIAFYMKPVDNDNPTTSGFYSGFRMEIKYHEQTN